MSSNNALRLLAIDVGTQSTRAILFDLKGDIQAKAQIPIEPYFSRQPGWAEQEAHVYWDAVCQACQQLWQQADPASVAGISLTTQRGTVVNLDAQGQVLRPAIVWMDQRRTKKIPKISPLWRFAFKLAGVSDTIADFQAKCQANWQAAEQPEIWGKTAKYLLLSGFLSYRLTGEYVDSSGCQVGYIPFDFKRLDWAGPRDWKWQAVKVRPEQLPRLVQPGQQLGRLQSEAATALGLPEGVPIIAAAADKACEVLGAGCMAPHQACLSFGTTATLNTTRSKYLEVIPYIPPYPGALPNRYTCEIQIDRGFWMVSWFKEEFAHREQRIAAERGFSPEELFDELVEQVPPGSMGLMLQPYWSPGVREPGPEATGAVIGFGDVHGRAHFYRSILEGLAYALRGAREKTQKRGKLAITELRIAGGGSQSDAAMQISADVFGMPAMRPHIYETSALGAAINTAVGLGHYSSYEEALKAMTRPGEVFQPRAEAVELYDALYRRVYQKMYPRLQALYKEIRDITGYPA
ncbi:MAG: FGGY-family carbohydrate kinase [Salinisphaeraceae bacterium]|nr:FGGY-family carbohydrate kinase [Salinisphaeraceae bacterium]